MAGSITPESEILINGNSIQFLSWQIVNGESTLEHSFSIRTEPTVTVNIGDTVTINSLIGGKTYTILSEGEVESIAKELGVNGVILNITGRDKSVKLLRLAPVKYIYFVDKYYLNRLCGGENNWTQEGNNGPIKWRDSDYRVILGGLPNEDIKDDELEIHVGQWTSHTIAEFLASKIGLEFECNAPSYYVDDIYVAPKDSTYWNSIINLFNIYNLSFFIRNNKIQVYDVDLYKHSASTSLSNKTTVVLDRTEIRMSGEIINDLKIIGKEKPPSAPGGLINPNTNNGDEPPGSDEKSEPERNELGLEYLEYTYVVNMYNAFPTSVLTDTSVISASELASSVDTSSLWCKFENRENQVISTLVVHVWMFAHGRALYIRKRTEDTYALQFDDSGNATTDGYQWVAKKTTKYKYDEGFNLRKVVEIHRRGPLQGGSWQIDHNFDYLVITKKMEPVPAWDVVNITEVHEGYVIYDSYDGKKYNPRPLNEAVGSGIIETNDDSIQNIVWCLIKVIETVHDMFHPRFIEKSVITGDYLNNVISMEKELLPLPEYRADQQEDEPDNTNPSTGTTRVSTRRQHYTWRYSNYTDENDHYPLVILSNPYFVPDVVAAKQWAGKPLAVSYPNYGDDDLPSKQADYVWEKIQQKRNTYQIRLRIRSNVPLPTIEKGQIVRLPDKDYQQYNFLTKSWVSVGLSTETYWVVSYTHSCNVSDKGMQWITELGLSNVMIG